MYVVATAGHVDHGKSTLMRALTGIEPDRWDEEKRRGLTIDLGFAWTTTASGSEIAFVDVPGHERFLGNMLAGIGPAPVVCFVVAADEGWRQQSGDHRDAIAALGIEHGVIAITRTDLAPERVLDVERQVRAELAATGLRDAPVVPVSARTGDGLDTLLATLESVLRKAPAPLASGRIRLWVDRAFTIRGAGTVVTGTLSAGTLSVGDRLLLSGAAGERAVVVRGLQQHRTGADAVGPVSRVAVNLRGVEVGMIHRGDVLITPEGWEHTTTIDVQQVSGGPLQEAAEHLTAHVGTLAVPARLRPFDDRSARLLLGRALPLTLGDRIILQDNGSRRIIAGVRVIDVDPPDLRRRGDGRRRADVIGALPPTGDVRVDLARRGAMRRSHLERLGVALPATPPEGVRVVGEWWIDERSLRSWAAQLRAAAEADHVRNPLSPGLSRKAAGDSTGVPNPALLDHVIREAGLLERDSVVTLPGRSTDLAAAEGSVAALEARLTTDPFVAPEAGELAELGLGRRELAAAERAGRLLRLADGLVLLPTAPALAMRELAKLPGPFTTSEARLALQTTRRVAIPLLEHLDARGWTKRVDGTHRVVARSRSRAD